MKKVSFDDIHLINDDCFEYFKTLEDDSVDLIVTDPPYYGVKKEKWDNQWKNLDGYLAFIEQLLKECWRVLKPNGSFYLFSGYTYAADIEILLRGHFNLLNHIIWAKPSGIWGRANKESLRVFSNTTERIFFLEHIGAEDKPKKPRRIRS